MHFQKLDFSELFHKYYTEIYPARIVFISFLEANAQGQMVTDLREIDYSPIQYKFDRRRPDLTKFDGLLGLLSTETDDFAFDLDHLSSLKISSPTTTVDTTSTTLADTASTLTESTSTPMTTE
jgi:hypothetical protein